MAIESVGQLIGLIVGALAGHAVATMIAGDSYQHVGGGWFEVTENPIGCLQGCLVEIVCVGLGAGIGYFIGSMLTGF